MNNPIHDELLRLSLKRELTEDDRARVEASLAAHPELREMWEHDAAFGRLLRHMPDVAISSNFTARVLDAIDLDERESARAARAPAWRAWLRRVLPQVGLGTAAAAVVVVAFGTYRYRVQQHDLAQARIVEAQFAHDIRHVSQDLASVPNPEVFRDFEAINQFRQVSTVSDDELLRVLR